jgi:hypothetical protein
MIVECELAEVRRSFRQPPLPQPKESAMSSAGAAPCAAVPVSTARAEASRRKRSRGPKTPEGKARASRNALRHGLRAANSLTTPVSRSVARRPSPPPPDRDQPFEGRRRPARGEAWPGARAADRSRCCSSVARGQALLYHRL